MSEQEEILKTLSSSRNIRNDHNKMQSLCTKIIDLEEMMIKKQSIISSQEDKLFQQKNDMKLVRAEIK